MVPGKNSKGIYEYHIAGSGRSGYAGVPHATPGIEECGVFENITETAAALYE
jgi:hypothetical protein